jgi:hypothetical protein
MILKGNPVKTNILSDKTFNVTGDSFHCKIADLLFYKFCCYRIITCNYFDDVNSIFQTTNI